MSDSLEVKVDTGGDDVHHPYTAFNQGFEAFDSGFPKECNPYDDSLKDWWDTGWEEALDQENEKDYGSNAGIRCDTDDGPCACGAWH